MQIAALEFAEERDRARDRLVLVLVIAIAAAFALLAANTLVVALLWDRLGWVTLALLTLLWAAIAALAGDGAAPARIGSLVDTPGIRLIDDDEATIDTDELHAFDHFR